MLSIASHADRCCLQTSAELPEVALVIDERPLVFVSARRADIFDVPDHDVVVAGLVLIMENAVDPTQASIDERISGIRWMPLDAAPLVSAGTRKATGNVVLVVS